MSMGRKRVLNFHESLTFEICFLHTVDMMAGEGNNVLLKNGEKTNDIAVLAIKPAGA